TCTVEEAVALLLKHFGRLHRARECLDTAIQNNDARLLCGDNVVNPDFFANHLRIAIAPDGRAEIKATRSLEPGPHDWRLVRRAMEARAAPPPPLVPIETEAPSPSPPSPPPPPAQESTPIALLVEAALTAPPLSSPPPQEPTPIALLVEAALAAPPWPPPTVQESAPVTPTEEHREEILGSRLIKSTIQEQRRGRQRPGNFAPACRSGLRCA